MKKFSFILILTMLILLLSMAAYASDDLYSKYEAYGLCVVSKILPYDEAFNMNSIVDKKTYTEMMNLWFGTNYDTGTNPTNSDAVYALSLYAPKNHDSLNSITKFKDYGFIKKEHRDAYKIMCGNGFINSENQYLKPNYPLTYGSFFEMLIHFEDEFICRNGFNISEGLITDSFSEDNDIIIKQAVRNKETEFKFNRIHSFYVQSNNSISPYSYNIKKGQNAKIYLLDNSIVYVSIKNNTDKFSTYYNITKSKIFLCNPYENKIIFINDQTGTYAVYTYDDDLYIYNEKRKISFEDINNHYTDYNCYIITEKNSNKIKYINITG